ncbi:MAG TPA: MarR family transcriptional regulator [Mycobacteriales bacterium]|nr:MarR family transcriptional regulator [Mycobacteriales bacterium]
MTERDAEQVKAAVEHMALIFTDWGFPRMPSRVLVTLMAADEEALTAADLSERLGVSAAAISGAVRYLIHIGMLQRVPTPNSRRDRYRLPADPWYESASLRDGFMSQIAAASDDGVKALGPGSPGGVRVERMRDFFVFIQAELGGLLEKWRIEHPPAQ